MHKLIIGCGYLGERLAQEWLTKGHDVWVLTRSADRAVRFSESGFKPVIGDVLDPNSLQMLPESETILYAVGFDRTSEAPKRKVYVDGLRNVLSEIRLKCRRFIYISSTSVYGQDGGELVDELSPTNVSDENGRLCQDAEAVVWQHFQGATQETIAGNVTALIGPSGMAIILRLAGIYGPGRLLARVEQLRRGEQFNGNPDAWLNLIHVDDAVRAVMAAEIRGKPGETYLVCDDRPLRRREYFAALAERFGAPPPQFEELAAEAPERGRLNKRCLNRRLRTELGVDLKYPTFIDGLRSLAEARQ